MLTKLAKKLNVEIPEGCDQFAVWCKFASWVLSEIIKIHGEEPRIQKVIDLLNDIDNSTMDDFMNVAKTSYGVAAYYAEATAILIATDDALAVAVAASYATAFVSIQTQTDKLKELVYAVRF